MATNTSPPLTLEAATLQKAPNWSGNEDQRAEVSVLELLSTPIENIGLSIRLYKLCEKQGWRLAYEIAGLLEYPKGFGPGFRAEVATLLKRVGLTPRVTLAPDLSTALAETKRKLPSRLEERTEAVRYALGRCRVTEERLSASPTKPPHLEVVRAEIAALTGETCPSSSSRRARGAYRQMRRWMDS